LMRTLLDFTTSAMFSKSFVVALAATLEFTQAHYTFDRLSHNGQWKAPLQYIRNKTERYEERPIPTTNVWSRCYDCPTWYLDEPNSVRCGRGNMDHAADTEVLTVKAGDTFEIALTAASPRDWTDAHWYNCPDGRGTCNPESPDGYWRIIHTGPIVVHLSKVPSGQDIQTYDGAGDWLKIFTMGMQWRGNENPENPIYWMPHNDSGIMPRVVYKIPPQTPAGDYLMRMDQIWPGIYPADCWVMAQMYPTCAQIRVESTSSLELPGGIKLPRDVIHFSPGMTWSQAMADGKQVDEGWVYPGGPLWDGEGLVEDRPIV
jgi:hypothetical protein